MRQIFYAATVRCLYRKWTNPETSMLNISQRLSIFVSHASGSNKRITQIIKQLDSRNIVQIYTPSNPCSNQLYIISSTFFFQHQRRYRKKGIFFQYVHANQRQSCCFFLFLFFLSLTIFLRQFFHFLLFSKFVMSFIDYFNS